MKFEEHTKSRLLESQREWSDEWGIGLVRKLQHDSAARGRRVLFPSYNTSRTTNRRGLTSPISSTIGLKHAGHDDVGKGTSSLNMGNEGDAKT